MRGRHHKIQRRALRVEQDPAYPLYLFTLTGEELLSIASISRVSRDAGGKLIGYQRPEVKRHIRNIVEYLDGGRVLFPNPIILALPSGARFREVRGPKVGDGLAVAGTLEIPVPRNGGPKPAWIVDGQQRAIALSKSKRKDLPVPVNAFVADDVDMQREQFLRINSTKPLPRGLITELLPEVSTVLPPHLAVRRAPAALCDLLNRDPESPFRGLIRRASDGRSKQGSVAVVSDTTVVQILQDSLTSPSGCLFPYRNLATGETDFAGVRGVLLTYWNGVRHTFPEAWGLAPTQSRLMHSAGLRAMGRLMDRVMAAVNWAGPHGTAAIRRELARVRPRCRWTAGNWEELGGLRWNELQNIPSHVRMLSNYLIRAHLSGRRGTE
jgi:DGQHR domain-containing protein